MEEALPRMQEIDLFRESGCEKGETAPLFKGRPDRIVLLHLDSLNCLPALNELYSALDGRIGLCVSSDRFAGMTDLVRQFWRNFRRSGLRLTLVLGFDIVALRIASAFAPLMRWLGGIWRRWPGGEPAFWQTLTELATKTRTRCVTIHDINGPAALDLVRQYQPDLVVSFHFDQILRPSFLKAAACPVVNVHPALLPAHRGPCPAFWTLASGDVVCGVSVHRIVDSGIDSGPVLAQMHRPIPRGVRMGELDELLFLDGARALVSLLSSRASFYPYELPHPEAYETFPDRSAIRVARRRGVRLWRIAQAARLIAGLFGWCRPPRHTVWARRGDIFQNDGPSGTLT